MRLFSKLFEGVCPINSYYIISPLLGAIIGYFTNWLAIKMLFRPYTEKRIFGFTLPFTPGLIPKRREILAKKVAQTVSVHLLTDETLVKSMCTESVKKNVESILDGFLCELKTSDKTLSELISPNTEGGIRRYAAENAGALCEALAASTKSAFFIDNVKPVIISIISSQIKGLASLFVSSENVYESIVGNLSEYLKKPENLPAITDKAIEVYEGVSESVRITDVSSKIDERYYEALKSLFMSRYEDAVESYFPLVFEALSISDVIEGKINEFEMAEAEEIIISVVDRELKAITYLGGLLGFIIGIVPPVLQSLGI